MKIKSFFDKAFKIASAATFVAGIVVSFTPAFPIGFAMIGVSTAALMGRQIYKGIRNYDRKGNRWKDLTTTGKISRVLKVTGTVLGSGSILAGMAIGEELGKLINWTRRKFSRGARQPDSSNAPSHPSSPPPPSSSSLDMPPISPSEKQRGIDPDMSTKERAVDIASMSSGEKEKLCNQLWVMKDQDATHTSILEHLTKCPWRCCVSLPPLQGASAFAHADRFAGGKHASETCYAYLYRLHRRA